MQMNWLALWLVLASIHSCRGYPWPTDCRVERFRGSPCWLTPPDNTAAGNQTGDVVRIYNVDCTVPHLKFNWMATAAEGHTHCFQPLYRCTWNSTELEPQSIDYIKTTVDDGREVTVEDTSINLTVGSECTFGGCYIDFNPTTNTEAKDEWYNVYWIEPVTCIINDNGCVKNPNACDSNADCSDIIGGFECTCRSGYTGNRTYCQDVDECSAGLHNCSDYADCSNTEGGFDCECAAGFTGDGFHCANIDECIEGLHGCHQNAECIDTVGGYRCTCETGFVGDGYSCEIGPLIGVLGIGFPALLLLAVCAVVVAICWMVIRSRQKAAELQYMEYFFPWKEPLNPDVEIVDAERRVSFALSLDSVFDSLIKPDKTSESAHSSDGNNTDISFEDTQLLPNHKDRNVVSAGEELKTAIGHQLAARDRTSTVVQDGLIKTPASVQTNAQPPSQASSSSRVNHSGYIEESSVTTPTGNSEYARTQKQGNYVREDEDFLANVLITHGTSEPVSQQQRGHVQGGSGYVREIEREGGSGGYVTETRPNGLWQTDDRERALDFLDSDQGETEDVILSNLDAHSSLQVGSDSHDSTNPTSGLDQSAGYLSHSAVLTSQVLRSQVQPACSELNHEQVRDGVTPASGYTQQMSLPGSNIVRLETGGYVGYQQSTDSGYVHGSNSTEHWAEMMEESLSIHLEDEEVFESATVLPKVDGYVKDSVGPTQPPIALDSLDQPVRTDYVTVDESSFTPLHLTTNLHLDSGYIQNPPMTDSHTTDISQCPPRLHVAPMDPSYDCELDSAGPNTSGYISYLELPTGPRSYDSTTTSGYTTA